MRSLLLILSCIMGVLVIGAIYFALNIMGDPSPKHEPYISNQTTNTLKPKTIRNKGDDSVSIQDFTFWGYHMGHSIGKRAFNALVKKMDSVIYDTGEGFDSWSIELHLKKSFLQFDMDSSLLLGFTFNDNNFPFIIKNHRIKIGDDIAVLKSMFPLSYANKNVNKASKQEVLGVSIIGQYGKAYIVFLLKDAHVNGIHSEYYPDETD